MSNKPAKRPYPVARPFILTFARTGMAIPIPSIEAERLIAAYPVQSATAYKVVLVADGGGLVTITPATYGGGPAFTF